SIFAYIDQLSAMSAEGYALEQSTAAGAQGARRQRLVRLLVREPPAAPLDIGAAAASAGWRIPQRLAALVVPADDGDRVVPRLPADVIADEFQQTVVALVPDPERSDRGRQLERAVGPRQVAVLGPTVPWR